jgi:hypothetical protein
MINFLIRASNREQAMRRASKRPPTLSITEFSDIADALERIGTQHDPERLMKCVQLALKANQQKRDGSHDNGLTQASLWQKSIGILHARQPCSRIMSKDQAVWLAFEGLLAFQGAIILTSTVPALASDDRLRQGVRVACGAVTAMAVGGSRY